MQKQSDIGYKPFFNFKFIFTILLICFFSFIIIFYLLSINKKNSLIKREEIEKLIKWSLETYKNNY